MIIKIIKSLLDTDFYTFTQGQVAFHHYPNTWVKYKFKSRNRCPIPDGMKPMVFFNTIKSQIEHFCSLTFKTEELEFLRSTGLFKPTYIEFLRILKLDRRFVQISLNTEDLKTDPEAFEITIKGPWYLTIFFEVPILAIVSEVYHSFANPGAEMDALRILTTKINNAKNQLGDNGKDFHFVDFGTRRRYSLNLQWEILEMCQRCMPENFMGTSNVMMSKEIGMRPKGTMSHQYFQAHQQLVRLQDHQRIALEVWAKEYEGNLGIALSDIVGFDAFLRDFNGFFAKLFDGCRHDSGDPFDWGEKLILHYIDLFIKPMTKQAIWSDGLTFETAISLYLHFYERIQTSFGIGTSLTNDTGVPALQIVIKMIECNGWPVAKIADSAGKGMCENEMFETYIKDVFKIK
jgi:nicotinate phosphoribosyltransferase